MKQLSLLDDAVRLSGVMAAIKTAMRDAAGAPEGEGRKMLADRLNEIAQRAGIKLTGGNTLSISKATSGNRRDMFWSGNACLKDRKG